MKGIAWKAEKDASTEVQSKQFLTSASPRSCSTYNCLVRITCPNRIKSAHWWLSVNPHLFQRHRVKIHSFFPTGDTTLLPLDSWQATGMVCRSTCNLYATWPWSEPSGKFFTSKALRTARSFKKSDSPLKESDLQNIYSILSPQPPTQLAETNQCISRGTLKNQLPWEYMFMLLDLKTRLQVSTWPFTNTKIPFMWMKSRNKSFIQNQDNSLPFQQPNP